jgi:hypothetical protein
MSNAAKGLPLRPGRSGSDPSAVMRRRQRAGQSNRVIGWILLPELIITTIVFHTARSGTSWGYVADALSILLIILTFAHAFLSFYVFGAVRPRRTMRVFHIYFGYLTFLLVMLSQSTITGPAVFHIVTSVLMYIAIIIHTVIGVRYQVIRSRAQRNSPELVPANTR